MDTPERVEVIAGAEEESLIIDRRNEFFAQKVTELGLPIFNPFTEVVEKVAGFWGGDRIYSTADKMHHLLIFDELIALVMDRRNHNNRHEITFWQREPSDRCKQNITHAIESHKDNPAI